MWSGRGRQALPPGNYGCQSREERNVVQSCFYPVTAHLQAAIISTIERRIAARRLAKSGTRLCGLPTDHFANHAEEILSQDLLQVAFCIASFQQHRNQRRHL